MAHRSCSWSQYCCRCTTTDSTGTYLPRMRMPSAIADLQRLSSQSHCQVLRRGSGVAVHRAAEIVSGVLQAKLYGAIPGMLFVCIPAMLLDRVNETSLLMADAKNAVGAPRGDSSALAHFGSATSVVVCTLCVLAVPSARGRQGETYRCVSACVERLAMCHDSSHSVSVSACRRRIGFGVAVSHSTGAGSQQRCGCLRCTYPR